MFWILTDRDTITSMKDKAKKYAMRSDVQTFKVSDYATAGGDKIRLMGAYAPKTGATSKLKLDGSSAGASGLIPPQPPRRRRQRPTPS